MKRRIALAFAALVAWVAGAALGVESGRGPVHARAEPAPEMVIGRAHEARNLPPVSGDRPIFILALGSDARPGQPIDNERSDSIHIIGINPEEHRASILGFPRDSWVNIPGHGTNKINSAMAYGGPDLAVHTLESLTGIHIDYYLLTSFGGLARMVSSIGGITVHVPFPMHDSYSGADFSQGVHILSGREALAFSRDRHDVPGGDLGRSANQGRLLLAALAKFHKVFSKDPSSMLRWVGIGLRNVSTDLSVGELARLAFTAAEIPVSNVKNVVVPGSTGSSGGASVVYISGSASSIYTDMRRDGVIGR